MHDPEPTLIAEVARSALACEGVRTRHLAQRFLRHTPRLADVPPPADAEPDVLAAAAGLLELFAARQGEPPPPWTATIERAGDPIFLFPCEEGSFTYQLCLAESPPPLRQRQRYAPATYLTWA